MSEEKKPAEEAALPASTTEEKDAPPVLSKKQQKRLARYGGVEGIKEHWEKRKAVHKERQRNKRRKIKEEKEEVWKKMTEEEQDAVRKAAGESWTRKLKEKEDLEKAIQEACDNKTARPQLVIDMDFEKEMDEKAMKSLAQQVSLSHAYLRKAGLPCWLTLAGLSEKGRVRSCLNERQNFSNWKLTETAERIDKYLPLDETNTIYLTGDSPNTLETIKPGVNYVIGGIVDRNRCKGITLKKATALGIGHAKLPLDDFLTKANVEKIEICKTLTTNHVVEILTQFQISKSWDAAFMAVLPTRRVAEKEDVKDLFTSANQAFEAKRVKDAKKK
eukprot:TRINITY_DN8571_c0_g1_i3.p1 TRINITY_DN8571_c0_g1~~TRINITY_DN8571_c0_g1_i3.p1  ORF type:complete len:345 (+),score=102.74 TRINITY_DN8571_c0_g1_i3:43-1035(+)